MSQAPAYNRSKNFADNSPDRTDHVAINTELDAAAQSINALRINAALIQADDGSLKAAIVTIASLSAEVLSLMYGLKVMTIQGPQGPVGASFSADYRGLASEKTAFDGKPKGFSFLSMDAGLMYFKLSDASGAWSTGYPFAKGETGATGAAGAAGSNGLNGASGVVTSVDSAVKTVGLTGKTALNISASLVGGQLRLNVSTV